MIETKETEDTPKQNEITLVTKKVTSQNTIIKNPIKGNVISLNKVEDDVFALETMGKGIAINPIEGKWLHLLMEKLFLYFLRNMLYVYHPMMG
ncbi:PTS glucose transporter subunit IIA [Bacillus megaterium]|nr:PTS glucose transporter subunit IIA [Priestia megaterium]